MIEGALSRMSLMKRITIVSFSWRPYSARYVPASMPSGAPIATPRNVIMIEPTMAFASPPVFDPGGGVICVNTDRLMPPNPSQNSVKRMSPRKVMPKTAAALHSARMMRLRRLRRA